MILPFFCSFLLPFIQDLLAPKGAYRIINMKIAVTGATGTVGTALIKYALDRGHSIVGIDVAAAAQDALPDVEPNITASATSDKDFKFIQADLRDYDQVLSVLTGCDAIAHLAAIKTPEDGKVVTHNK